MEQGTSKSADVHIESTLPSLFDDEEMEVSYILLNLSNLISEWENRRQLPVSWAARRKRSAVNESGPSPVEREREKKPKVKDEATSPLTPLSFPPSESDEKSKHSRKKFTKKPKREELLEKIDGLIEQRELLRGEIETVKSYYNKIKAFNLELKAKKQELSITEAPQLGISKSLNSGMELSKSIDLENQDHHPQDHSMVHQQPSIADQAASGSQISENLQHPHGQIPPLLSTGSGDSGLAKVKHVGPLGIPDLNVVAEDTFGVDSPQPLDHSRVVDYKAKAAEARRRRMAKIKEMKNSFAATKTLRCR